MVCCFGNQKERDEHDDHDEDGEDGCDEDELGVCYNEEDDRDGN